MKKIKNTYIIMAIITIVVLIIPLFMRITLFSDITSWVLFGLKKQEYKSAYLGIIGSLAGSWLAITGAIYTQRKFDEEKKAEEDENRKSRIITKQGIAVTMCKELLWNEIIANHHSLYGDKGAFLVALKEEQVNYIFGGHNKFRLENWLAIRSKIIEDNMFCAIKIMKLYKFYEFLSNFEGSAKEALDLSQLDFAEYMEIYNEVKTYLEIGA